MELRATKLSITNYSFPNPSAPTIKYTSNHKHPDFIVHPAHVLISEQNFNYTYFFVL